MLSKTEKENLMRRAVSEREQAIAAANAAYAAQARLLDWDGPPPAPPVGIIHIDDEGEGGPLGAKEAVRRFILRAPERFSFEDVVVALQQSGIPAKRATIATTVARAVIAGEIKQVERGSIKGPAVYVKPQ